MTHYWRSHGAPLGPVEALIDTAAPPCGERRYVQWWHVYTTLEVDEGSLITWESISKLNGEKRLINGEILIHKVECVNGRWNGLFITYNTIKVE